MTLEDKLKDSPIFTLTDNGILFANGEEVKPVLNNSGYLVVSFAGSKQYVHRLVAEVFIDNPDKKRCVNHLNGDKLDNRVSNLEWSSYGDNMRHAYLNGLYQYRKGSKQNNAKLTETGVVDIKRRLEAGEKGVDLAREYGVAHGRIYDIKHGRSWAHVTADEYERQSHGE